MIEADVIFGEHEVNTPAPATVAPPAVAPEGSPAVAPEGPPAVAPEVATEDKQKKSIDGAKIDEAKPAAPAQAPAVQTPDVPVQAAPAQAPTGTNSKIPVMGHPPATKSDLSLEQFLDAVVAHNKDAQKPKGVKLDFKSIDALKQSKNAFKSTKDVRIIIIIEFYCFKQISNFYLIFY